jgi:hypothetical protein
MAKIIIIKIRYAIKVVIREVVQHVIVKILCKEILHSFDILFFLLNLTKFQIIINNYFLYFLIFI